MKSITFSGLDIQEILARKKGHFTTLLNLEKINHETEVWHPFAIAKNGEFCSWIASPRISIQPSITPCNYVTKHPYGKLGDVLWVQETFRVEMDRRIVEGSLGKHINPAWTIIYKATEGGEGPWRSATSMPKHTSRIILKIKKIGVGKLEPSRNGHIKEGPVFFREFVVSDGQPQIVATEAKDWCTKEPENPWAWITYFEVL